MLKSININISNAGFVIFFKVIEVEIFAIELLCKIKLSITLRSLDENLNSLIPDNPSIIDFFFHPGEIISLNSFIESFFY